MGNSPSSGMGGLLGAGTGALGVLLAPATFGTSLLPAMAIGGGLGSILGGSLFGEDQTKKQEESNSRLMAQQTAANQAAMAQQQNFWKENAYPSEEAIAASKKSSLADMNAQAQTAQKNFLESASARGIQGGGAIGAGLSDIERQRQKTYGSMLNRLTQYANTPMFNPTYAGNVSGLTGVSGAQTQGSSGLDSMLGTIGGLYGYNALMGGGSGAGFSSLMPANFDMGPAALREMEEADALTAILFGGDMMTTPSLGSLSVNQIMALKEATI